MTPPQLLALLSHKPGWNPRVCHGPSSMTSCQSRGPRSMSEHLSPGMLRGCPKPNWGASISATHGASAWRDSIRHRECRVQMAPGMSCTTRNCCGCRLAFAERAADVFDVWTKFGMSNWVNIPKVTCSHCSKQTQFESISKLKCPGRKLASTSLPFLFVGSKKIWADQLNSQNTWSILKSKLSDNFNLAVHFNDEICLVLPLFFGSPRVGPQTKLALPSQRKTRNAASASWLGNHGKSPIKMGFTLQ